MNQIMNHLRSLVWCIMLALIASTQSNAQEGATWSGQIACIIYSHCSTCHNDGGIAPFSLMSYQDAQASRFAIQHVVTNRIMPPWPPDPSYNRLAHERLLSDEEVSLIDEWVKADAPAGDLANAPQAPIFETNLEISQPDMELNLPIFTVPQDAGEDVYRCFVIPTDEDEDRFITGMEIIPGNRNIVHHVLVYQDTTGVPEALDAADPGVGYTCFGGIGSDGARLISGWVPGGTAYFTPPRMGVFLPAGANLIVQIHYPEGSEGQVDSTKINLQLSDDMGLRRMENLPLLNHITSIDRWLIIPANTQQTFYQEFTVPFNLSITGIAPHAHLLCTSMTAFAVRPNGDTIPLIHIPKWDFEWQGFYNFRNPIRLPFGTRLHGIATYDNTAENPNNPNDPPQLVTLGEATTDEMMLFFTPVTFYFAGDENIVIDDSEHPDHHDDCELLVSTSNTDGLPASGLKIYPNPFSQSITIESKITSESFIVVISDLVGREVARFEEFQGLRKIQTSDLFPGLYILNVLDHKGNYIRSSRKLIKL